MSYSSGRSIVVGDSDDDGEPNTYDYNDSFIDDEGQFIFSSVRPIPSFLILKIAMSYSAYGVHALV